MVALSSIISFDVNHIRKMDLSRDLDQVADLIERCFPIHMDRDGQTYIQEMRKAARDMRFLGWLSSMADLSSTKAPGFVWEEDDRIIGNISLIPFKDQGKDIYLIANVAVDPDCRRRGIGRALTNHALAFMRRLHVSQVWLQVRDDNLAAYQLYLSTGFNEHTVRSTWRIRPFGFVPSIKCQEQITVIRHRSKKGWADQKRWLLENYPTGIRWNLPVNFNRFEPGILQNVVNVLDGVRLKHWEVNSDGKCLGVITWQKTKSFANNLWLAFPKDRELIGLQFGLQKVVKQLSRKHPISIDYPKGRCDRAFEAMGFKRFRSLIWMKQNL